MTKTIVTIEDKSDDEVSFNIEFVYSEEEKDANLTSASIYGAIIHYLFTTGKINDYYKDLSNHLKDLENNAEIQNTEQSF